MGGRGGGMADATRFSKTNMSYGVNEVLLASVLGAVVFAVFAAQPLVIVGVTGPITVFN
jgi:boron transporter